MAFWNHMIGDPPVFDMRFGGRLAVP